MADIPQTALSWEDKAWLSTFPLNRDTVLDYFGQSPFMAHGKEYEIQHAHELPPAPGSSAHSLYVIRRNCEDTRGARGLSAQVRTLYYVLDGVVFEAPSLQAVLRTKLLRVGWLLGSAFDSAKSMARSQ